MKRLFLFAMMCLMGLFGLNAQTNVELTMGLNGEYVYGDNKLPTYTYYNYSITQQIYTAAELQELSGTITSISFRQTKDEEISRNLSVYMQNVDVNSFNSSTGWIPLNESDLVFAGNIYSNQAGAWIDLQLQTPFEYEGGNLLLCVIDNTGSYTNSGRTFDVYQHSNGFQTLYHYRDNAPYGLTNNIYGNQAIYKNVVKFNLSFDGELKTIAVKPSTIELGARPNNAWTTPYDVQIKAKFNDFTINAIESTNSYFQLSEVELPVTVTKTNPLNLTVVNGVAEGDVTAQLIIAYNESRKVEIIDMSAFAYTPVAGDVWETAEAITSYPFSVTPDLATTYNNYVLPGNETDGADVVYEVNFDNDVLFTANVIGENGKVAIYTADFNGEEGPKADNNYKGIQVGNANRASQISAMAIPAGKYYVAASSTGEFTLEVNAEAIPAPEKAYNPYPYDKTTGISYPTLDWDFGANTVEYQVLFGTVYPPKDVYVDWTNNLEVNHYMGQLYNNKIYFWQVNARNTSGTTYGDIWAFTTTFNEPENLKASDNQLYEGESTTITWDAVNDRSYRGYNIYLNNEKINTSLVTETSYTIENLEYSNYGHYVAVSAVYDEGESNPCDGVVVYVTGMTKVAGNLYEQDGVTPLLGGTVALYGTDEFGAECSYTFTADETGAYEGEILVGNYKAVASFDGYQNREAEFASVYGETAVVDFKLTETYNPVKYVTATEVENTVEVAWGMQRYGSDFEDFETGDFSLYPWNNEVSDFPFAITTDAFEGEYAMKSTCEGNDYGVSAIELTVDVPMNGVVGFNYRISCEAVYDYATFYIDGEAKATMTGISDWAYKEVSVTEGTHTYRWEYAKDVMWEDGEDAFYVDNITFYKEPTPFEGGWLHYDDGTFASSIGLGSAAPMYWGIKYPETASYAGYTISKVAIYDTPADYAGATGTYTANIYLGGDAAPGSLVATQDVNLTGSGEFVEIELSTPVALDGTQALWITFYTSTIPFPAGGCAYVGDSNSDLLSLDGATWEHAADYDLSYTWMIRAYLDNAKGQSVLLSRESDRPEFKGGASTGSFVANVASEPIFVGVPSTESAEGSRAFASYNLYKKSILTGDVEKLLDKTADTSYVDYEWEKDEAGSYQWGVSATYEGNRASNVIFSEGFEGGVMPAGWSTMMSGSGNEAYSQWTVDTQEATGYSNPPTCYAYEGQYAVFSDGYSWSVPSYYLITPAITLQNEPMLSFYLSNPNWGTYYPAIVKVAVSESATGPWTEVWTTGNTQYIEWTQMLVDLSAYAGSTIHIAFVHEDHYGHYAGIDNVEVSCAAPESEILWSKAIDKDMYTTVAVAAQTDNGDPVSGTTVSFINMIEEGVDYTTTLGNEGTYTWDSFRKGTYELTVAKEGYASNVEAQVVEIMDASQFNAFLTEVWAAVEGLYVSPTGWAMWEGKSISAGGAGAEFTYGFDTDLEGWTTIDGNGDGHVWYHSSESEMSHAVLPGDPHTGAGCIYSESYCNALGALYPDDYIVSPERVAIGGSSVLKFYACSKDNEWASEHFGVAVSTAGNTSASDFTTIAEWTMTGKGEAKAPRGRGEQGTWYEFVTDLSEYAGQEVYLALRHFNTTDMFILMVDDMVLTNEAKADRALVKYQVLLDGVVEAEELLVPYYQHENVVDGVEYTTTVIASYTMGDSEEMSYTWTKASDTLFAGVRNLAASLEGEQIELSWTLPAPAPEVEETASSFFTDFESGYTGWPMIDADGDGFNWVYSTDYEDVNAFSGTNCMYSESYYNGEGAGSLEPDNYLIIPVKIEAQQGTTLSFMARAQDENWPEEYFGVAVSTTGNELAEDFTTVAEWIIAEDDKNDNVKRGKRGTPWTEFSADLSAYAGQNIWVAIRHFNCYGEFRLNIDDVKVSVEGGKDSKEGTWAYYDNGVNEDAIGGPQSFSWAIKLRAADIAELGALTKVAAFDRVATSGTFDICLGGDNEPGASVLNQAYTWTGINDFVEIPLTEAVDPAGQNVWIVFNTNDGTNYPAAECADTGDADGRWIYLASDGWFDVTEAGIPCTWMLRGYFEPVEGPEEPEEYAIAEILGVMIYRNGELITKQPVEGETYTDKKGVLGDEYCVQVVYGGELDSTYYAMSEADCTEAEYIIDCIAPEKLFGQYQYNEDGTFGAQLIWPYSNATTEWLYYDNGVNEDGIGGPASFMWGVMFPSNAISAYDGQFLTKVALFDFAQSTGDINIYYGGSTAPGTLVHTQPYTGTGAGAFVEFDLTSALPVDATQNIWVVFTTSQGTNYPASCCADAGDPNGRWISLDGATWEDLTAHGLSNTWMIRAMVATEAKGAAVSELKALDYEFTAAGEGEVAAKGVARGEAFDHYNIYRGTSANNFEKVGESTVGTYFDEVAAGTYYYQVTAVYAANGEECESEPATAYENADQDYVVVEVTAIDENGVNGMMVYPNPTRGALNIMAEGMTQVTVTNALGQVMYDSTVATDNAVIDMAQYEAGVYMVRIVTENGVAVKQITVVK